MIVRKHNAIIAAILLSLISLSALSHNATAETPPERPWLRESIGYAQVLKSSITSMENTPAAAIAGAETRLVFSSYRNNHWELFTADGDGNDQKLLPVSYNTALRPSLRRGGARVIFISEYNTLETVYVSGQPARYEVNGSANSPRWSPSGKILAYTLRATQQSPGNIYTRQENQTAAIDAKCLTCDLAGNHAEPAWSPNGTEIIWVRVAPGNTRTGSLWRMSANGSDKRQISNELFYLSNPAWSPDGRFIAFDASSSALDWNQLYVMNLANGQVTQIFNPGQNGVEAWMGNWTLDGTALLFSRVEYAVENNQLVFSQTFIERVPAGGGMPKRLTFSGRDLYPSTAWLDRIPPQSYFAGMQPLSLPLAAYPILASDAGEAGLSGKVDVQYRIGESGVWQNVTQGFCWPWLAAAGPIGPCTNAQLGDKVYLRGRAYDRASNVKSWPANPDYDTYTILYTQVMTGSVTDVRGVQQVGVAVTPSSSSLLPVQTASTGQYAAYFAVESSQVLTPAKAGFGLSLGVMNSSSATNLLHVLPPIDNLIQDGDFEQDGAGWQLDPAPPAFNFNGPHSGMKGAILIGNVLLQNTFLEQTPRTALSQTLTLPSNLHQPTLSFVTQASASLPTKNSDALTVTVQSEDEVTTIKVIPHLYTGTPKWRHDWVDLSAWAGKRITVTFAAQLQPFSSFSLDEVSIGEWKTPVAASITPNQLTAGGNNTVVISGTNFIGTPTVKIGPYTLLDVIVQPNGTLRGDLPAQVSAGQYDVMVINPEGQVSVVPNAFQFGSRVSVPILLKDVE